MLIDIYIYCIKLCTQYCHRCWLVGAAKHIVNERGHGQTDQSHDINWDAHCSCKTLIRVHEMHAWLNIYPPAS